MSSPDLNFHIAIVCDDIRTEKSGKYVFVGVYDSYIEVPELPAVLNLCFAIPGTAKTSFSGRVEFRVNFGNAKIASGVGSLEIIRPGESMLILPKLALSIPNKDGLLRVKMRVENGRWKTVRSIPVRLKEPE